MYIHTNKETGAKHQVIASTGKHTNGVLLCLEWMKKHVPDLVEQRRATFNETSGVLGQTADWLSKFRSDASKCACGLVFVELLKWIFVWYSTVRHSGSLCCCYAMKCCSVKLEMYILC